ncbi:hypothetical protein QTP81_13645 [Alteromonas sp. ASW11-36]|uniref:Uncharacterized protein n=1 Tax=Alteromonas arenosi TaxID=3055817 RepID=A0ABT7SZM6_9ALTE|nr:hypothetical protein [Alteromonas sp. ASW11-36]MDM7861639.1 hypothetical protein [Alteromonas sp. ASW11-36]
MNTVNFLYKSPFTWALLLALILFYVADVLGPTQDESAKRLLEYEEIMLTAGENPKIRSYIEAQHETLTHKIEVIKVLTDFQKYLSGFFSIAFTFLLFSSYIRQRREQRNEQQ